MLQHNFPGGVMLKHNLRRGGDHCKMQNAKCKPHRGKPADREGYALVLFVMMFFGLMGLAALVIDMGFARLAQRQMQTAVDSAALEGLRNDPTGAGRQQASQIVANMFTDYTDSSGATVHYGAGPVVNFSGGIGPTELAASQLMQPGSPPVYQPGGLQLNSGDAVNGDMRAGQYGLNTGSGQDAAYPTQATADEGGDTNHPADNPYSRRDFFQPQSGTTSNAFLVRMRRTSDTSGIDNDADISSGGSQGLPSGQYNTIPFLFGRGGMIHKDPASAYSPRQQGLTIRATAIAAAGDNISFDGGKTSYSAGRAKAAGPPYHGVDANNNPVNIPGVTPFAVKADAWKNRLTVIPVVQDNSTPLAAEAIVPAVVEIGQRIGTTVQRRKFLDWQRFHRIYSDLRRYPRQCGQCC